MFHVYLLVPLLSRLLLYKKVFGIIGESTYIGRGYEAGCGVGGVWRVLGRVGGGLRGLVMCYGVGGRIEKTSGSRIV